jgi:ATP-dependent RNA helicase RhlE
MKFNDYHILKDLKKNLEKLDIVRPTDIQFKAIPAIMKGEDVLAVAQTGTGKTAAFAIPLIDMIHNMKTSKRTDGIKALIMVPTRELAIQIGKVFSKLSKGTKVKSFAVFGGVEQDAQISNLVTGIDILIATPGRMFDLIHQGHITLDDISIIVLDEADQMLKLGFLKDIQDIKSKINHKHQTLFFSATIDAEIKKIAYSLVRTNAIRIEISPKDPVAKNITHFVAFIEMDDKRFFLKNLIENNPDYKIIVFVRTIVRADRVAKAMMNFNIETKSIHRDKDQEERTNIMKQFRNGEFKLLVATDLLARGIDVPNVDLVINYDLPEVAENYVHRVGRTGRGTNKGLAISFCSKDEKPILTEIEGFLDKNIEVFEMSKKEYRTILEIANEPDTWQDLMKEAEKEEKKWEEKKAEKKKKSKKKPKK